MIAIGNFFFTYRNLLFIFLYILLFVPSPPLFGASRFGPHYWDIPIILGLIITITGQAIRAATIGLAYIIRGGRDKKIFADELVTRGIFNHCRNPLYVGNILMLLGVGIISNSLIYVLVIMPVFIFIYHAIVLAEENYLQNKFGESFKAYCRRVNRWVPSLSHLSETFKSMEFKWKRWILKEYNTQFVWLSGITLILLLRYQQITHNNSHLRNLLLVVILSFLLLSYFFVRYLKKSRRLVE